MIGQPLRRFRASCVIRPLYSKRLLSDFSVMQEAFMSGNGNSNGPTTSTATSKSATKATPKSSTTSTTAFKPVDPVINISNDFTSPTPASNSYNSASAPSKDGTLSDYFGESMNDYNKTLEPSENTLNWAESFHGLGHAAFSQQSQDILYAEIPVNDVEITPDGLLYLPEIKYRRILNRSFGAGAWGLAPRSETRISKNATGTGGLLTREYGLVIHGRLVSIARGEQTFFSQNGIPTATEGCKSNALMRCCKDLGIASDLWDPRFIKKFKKANCEELFVEYIPTKKKKKIWKRKDEDVEYPFKR